MTQDDVTQDDVARVIRALGGVWYPDSLSCARCFSFGPLPTGMNCESNERPPSLRVAAHPDLRGHAGSVEFELSGQRGGVWIRVLLYSFRRVDVTAGLVERMRKVGASVWEGFAAGMRPTVAEVQAKLDAAQAQAQRQPSKTTGFVDPVRPASPPEFVSTIIPATREMLAGWSGPVVRRTDGDWPPQGTRGVVMCPVPDSEFCYYVTWLHEQRPHDARRIWHIRDLGVDLQAAEVQDRLRRISG